MEAERTAAAAASLQAAATDDISDVAEPVAAAPAASDAAERTQTQTQASSAAPAPADEHAGPDHSLEAAAATTDDSGGATDALAAPDALDTGDEAEASPACAPADEDLVYTLGDSILPAGVVAPASPVALAARPDDQEPGGASPASIS